MLRGLPPAVVLLIAVMAGSAMDGTIKYLAQTNHVLIVTLGRYVFGALFSFGVYLHARRPPISAEMWRAHGLRGLILAGSATSFFWALTVLPFAEVVTLSFVYPLIIPFVARMLLGERLRASSMVAAAIGFCGVALAAQGAPSAEQSPMYGWGLAAVLTAATLFAFAMVLLRARAQSDGPVIVALMTSLVPGMVVAGPAIAFGTMPNWGDWPIFLLLGAFAAVFMYLLAQAYARAQAQLLAPIHYTELIWASAIGYLVFAETVRVEIYMGAALIIAACLYTVYDERRIARTRALP